MSTDADSPRTADDTDRRAERKPQGWTEAALSAVISWFPDLPRPVKVVFASGTMYLVLCLMAQVSPVAAFVALQATVQGWVSESRAVAAAERASAAQDRQDVITLLREQNNALRDDLLAIRASAERPAAVAALEARINALDQRLAVLEAGHPHRSKP